MLTSGGEIGVSKLQALVYDILPLELGAGKRYSECEGCCRPYIPITSNSNILIDKPILG